MTFDQMRDILADAKEAEGRHHRRATDVPYTGALMADLIARVDNYLQIHGVTDWRGKWHAQYFATGILPIKPWDLIAHIRFALCKGANNDGLMSDGAVAVWYDLADIQHGLAAEWLYYDFNDAWEDAHRYRFCEALYTSGPEDQWGDLCGKELPASTHYNETLCGECRKGGL